MKKHHPKFVRRVKRYIIDAGKRPVRISELCKKFKVHKRTLHRAFIEAEGETPIDFARRHRFALVRAALKKKRGNKLIRDIAIAHGFLELGKFAHNYWQLYNELPSETLARSRRKTRKR